MENGNGAAASPSTAKKPRTEYQHTIQSFVDTYNVLRDEVLKDEVLEGQPDYAAAWFKEMMDYTVPGGKLNRGMAVYDALAAISKPESLSEQDIFRANALGWCIEWLQAFFLVADDIMDGSITRRGQPCWYQRPKVGLIACNDYILLECAIYRILKAHFASHPAYVQLIELFHEVTFQTSHGQLLDLITAPIGHVDLTKYTIDNYMRIVTFKTAFYSFYLPVACGVILAGRASPEALALSRDICIQMGQYFQVQDDYLDCYGAPEVIGKIGTDIEDNKCSWLICKALEPGQATDEQKEVIKANYGRKAPEAVAVIKALYVDLRLEAQFRQYEADSHAALVAKIQGQELLPQGVFMALLNKIFKRQK